MGRGIAPPRQLERQAGKPRVVTIGDRPAPGIIVPQGIKLDVEDRGLDRVESCVDSGHRADIAVAPAIFADLARGDGKLAGGGDGRPGIARAATASSRSLVTTAPASPSAPRFLVG